MSITEKQLDLIVTFQKTKNTDFSLNEIISIVEGKTTIEELKESSKKLLDFLLIANALYRSGYPIINDQYYDLLHANFAAIHPTHSFLSTVEPEAISDDNYRKVLLPQRMLSTEKAYSPEEIDKWLKRIKKCAETLDISTKTIIFKITPKLDGFAAFDDGDHLYTRGNGIKGTDISHVFKRGLRVTQGAERGMGPGEIVISKTYFEKHLSNLYENTRNIQASILAEKEMDDSILKAIQNGAAVFFPFASLPSLSVDSKQLMDCLRDNADDIRGSIDYDTDGLVLEATDEAIKTSLGSSRHHHRWQIAFKENTEFAIVEVLSVEPNTSRTGRLTPVAHIVPTKLSGATISKATAHNYGLVKKLGIASGAKVKLVRSGLVIPKIVEVVSPKQPTFPSMCPSCHSPVTWESDNIYCTNSLHCPAQAENSIIHFFKTLGTADGFGPSCIATLHKNNYRDIFGIYHLTKNDFEAIGFGPKVSANLEKNLLLSRQRNVEDWRFLAAFGIRHLGTGNSERILLHHNIEDIFTLTTADLKKIEGFAEKSADIIISGLKAAQQDFFSVLNLGFQIERTPKTTETSLLTDSPIKGKLIVFSGTMRSGARSKLENNAKILGAKVGKSVTGKTDYLVTGAKVGMNKIKSAKSKKVAVLQEDEYLTMISNE